MRQQSIDRFYWHSVALFYIFKTLLQHGLARHREMGQKKMGNHRQEHEAGSGGGVYDSSQSLMVHGGLSKPPSRVFMVFGFSGMGIGGVLDRPTDTLPHGVYGVDHSLWSYRYSCSRHATSCSILRSDRLCP
jgi:hypothetical protein